MVGLDRHRLLGHRGGHERVAVSVAADPRAEAKERRGERRARAGAPRIQGAVEGAVDLGHASKQRLVEHGRYRPHLVERLRLGRAQLPGAPQDVDLLEKAAVGVVALARGAARVVEAVELLADAPDRRDDGSPAGLGRVRGEHGLHLEATDGLAQPARSEQAAKVGDGGRERLAERLAAVPLAQHPRAVVLLGEVREVEVAGERTRDLLGSRDGPRRDEALGRLLLALR